MSESQRMRYAELSPGTMAAMRGVEHAVNVGSGLEPVLLELVRLRASLMNGCTYCIALHRGELGKHHEPESRVGAVADWRPTDAFTQRERAALAWTEVVTDVQDGHVPDEAFAAVREHFGEKDLVDLTVAIASINAWNRVAIAFRAEWRPNAVKSREGEREPAEVGERGAVEGLSEDGERAVLGDDGGKVTVDEG